MAYELFSPAVALSQEKIEQELKVVQCSVDVVPAYLPPALFKHGSSEWQACCDFVDAGVVEYEVIGRVLN